MTTLAEISSAAMTSASASGQPAVPLPGENLASAETVLPDAPPAAPDPGVDPGTVAPAPVATLDPATPRAPDTQADALLDSVPGQPAAYDFGDPPTLQKGGVDLVPDFRTWAHSAKLTQGQARSLLDAYNQRVEQFVENQNVQRATDADADIAAMQRQLGAAGYQATIERGQRAVKHLGLDQGTLEGIESVVGTAGVLQLAARIGALLEGPAAAPAPNTGSDLSPPLEQVEDLKSDPEFQKKYLGGDRSAMRRMTKAMRNAFPETL